MNKEIADLVDLQELFEMVGPSIFLDDFDISGFISSIKDEEGVLVPPRFDFSDYVPFETAKWITENSERFNMSDFYKVMDYQLSRTLAILLCHQNLGRSMEKTNSR